MNVNLLKKVGEENISQEFRLKNINGARNYLVEEIDQNELMSKRYNYVCTALNYIEHLLTLASAVTKCISISPSTSLVGIPIGNTSYAGGLKICAITEAVKKYKSIIKKKKKKHDKHYIVSKTKLISINILLSKVLIDLVMMNLF